MGLKLRIIVFFYSGGSVASAASTGAVGSGSQTDASALGHPADVLDMPVDPNEPTYCLCHQVSYGEMIGCDNPDVSILVNLLIMAIVLLGHP